MVPTRIFLLGFMSSGKSVLGRKLAKQLGYEFVDLDQFIETKQQKSITQLFEEFGESVFREIESNALNEVIEKSGLQVVSLGGGTPVLPLNWSLIKQHGTSIYLKVDPKILIGRLNASKKNRPLLAEKTPAEMTRFVHDLLAKREAIYEQADLILEENNPKIEQLISILT